MPYLANSETTAVVMSVAWRNILPIRKSTLRVEEGSELSSNAIQNKHQQLDTWSFSSSFETPTVACSAIRAAQVGPAVIKRDCHEERSKKAVAYDDYNRARTHVYPMRN